MGKQVKTIGVLTSGGDAPGMNAAVRAVVRTGISKGLNVVGVRRGYNGLINGDLIDMSLRSVSDIIHRGGTMLYTARCDEFRYESGLQKATQTCIDHGIDGVVVIGGDGSFRGARDLSLRGIPCVGIPGTIDNDIACTDYTIGYDTAMNTAMEMIDKCRDTAQSHDRCLVVEVMGRRCGDIALNTGIACGATSIVVPEVPFDMQKDCLERIQKDLTRGKRHFIIIVAEGYGKVEEIAQQVGDFTGITARALVLGHVQRGGNPSVRDRVMASEMGHYAIEKLLCNGIGNRVIALKDSKIVDFDILEALEQKKEFNMELYRIAHEISI
ncbi:6-phosphofructokinase [Zongyangia hominis]|uniref:ATP-dependent 6-phosphofructokinase n=1 Tax=Zongyangia hominis TaxID=2763677 RepID=A0A926EAP6_9FIRM|nr:6-phosphofructokinase [Zongyangia hominis]MBC8569530.1 6-phosphofructokinase [Zongyangia hominis]